MSSSKLNTDKILYRRIASQDTRTSLSRFHLDNNMIEQENKQQSESESNINKDFIYEVNST